MRFVVFPAVLVIAVAFNGAQGNPVQGRSLTPEEGKAPVQKRHAIAIGVGVLDAGAYGGGYYGQAYPYYPYYSTAYYPGYYNYPGYSENHYHQHYHNYPPSYPEVPSPYYSGGSYNYGSYGQFSSFGGGLF